MFIACGVASSGGKDDLYRKPKAGMWQLMKKHFNSGIEIDMDKLVFSIRLHSFFYFSLVCILTSVPSDRSTLGMQPEEKAITATQI